MMFHSSHDVSQLNGLGSMTGYTAILQTAISLFKYNPANYAIVIVAFIAISQWVVVNLGWQYWKTDWLTALRAALLYKN